MRGAVFEAMGCEPERPIELVGYLNLLFSIDRRRLEPHQQ